MKATTKQRKLDKPVQDLVTIGAKVDPGLHAEIKAIAQNANVSIAYIVEEALTEYIEKHKKVGAVRNLS